MNKWISVKDRLPELKVQVLTYDKDKDIEFGEYHGSYWVEYYRESMREVTHWQPLPEPPIQTT